jgi:hypothetical protein
MGLCVKIWACGKTFFLDVWDWVRVFIEKMSNTNCNSCQGKNERFEKIFLAGEKAIYLKGLT